MAESLFPFIFLLTAFDRNLVFLCLDRCLLCADLTACWDVCVCAQQVYKKGFYEGVMLVGSQAGKRVCDAKDVVRAEMIAKGQAAAYYEPEKLVCAFAAVC